MKRQELLAHIRGWIAGSSDPQTVLYLSRVGVLAKDNIIYKFGEVFTKELSQATLDLKKELIPLHNTSATIHYMGYVAVIWCGGVPGEREISCNIFDTLKSRSYGLHLINAYFKDDEDIEIKLKEAFGALEGEHKPGVHDLSYEAYKTAISCFIYLQSGDPDLTEYKPPTKEVPRRERDRMITMFGAEACTLVSWYWKKPHPEQYVRGHWKSQAYGPGRSLRRPQFIHSYSRFTDDEK